ncbi:MAG: hypothetical protein V3T83_12285, partial [Acidobacteriota bacterium]
QTMIAIHDLGELGLVFEYTAPRSGLIRAAQIPSRPDKLWPGSATTARRQWTRRRASCKRLSKSQTTGPTLHLWSGR